MLCNLNLHYGRLSLKGWEGMLFATEGKLDHHLMPQSSDPTERAVSRIGAHSGHRPGASAWVAQRCAPFPASEHTPAIDPAPPPGSCALARAFNSRFDRKITSGHHMSDAGISVRPCSESRGRAIRSLS